MNLAKKRFCGKIDLESGSKTLVVSISSFSYTKRVTQLTLYFKPIFGQRSHFAPPENL